MLALQSIGLLSGNQVRWGFEPPPGVSRRNLAGIPERGWQRRVRHRSLRIPSATFARSASTSRPRTNAPRRGDSTDQGGENSGDIIQNAVRVMSFELRSGLPPSREEAAY